MTISENAAEYVAGIIARADSLSVTRDSKGEPFAIERGDGELEYRIVAGSLIYRDNSGASWTAVIGKRNMRKVVEALDAANASDPNESPEPEVSAVEVVKLTEALEARDLTLWYDVVCSVYGASAGECQRNLERDLIVDAPGSVARLQDVARRARIALGCEKAGDLGNGNVMRAARRAVQRYESEYPNISATVATADAADSLGVEFGDVTRAIREVSVTQFRKMFAATSEADERNERIAGELLDEARAIAAERYERIAADVGCTPQQVRDVEASLAEFGLTAPEVRRAVESYDVEPDVDDDFPMWLEYHDIEGLTAPLEPEDHAF